MDILIVRDDEPGLAEDIRIAREAGFSDEQIATARDEHSALQAIRTVVPSIAVVDVHLSLHAEQEEGLRVIRDLIAYHRGCVVICVTASGSNEIGARAIGAGARDYIDLDWPRVNGYELLREKLILWKALLESRGGDAREEHPRQASLDSRPPCFTMDV